MEEGDERVEGGERVWWKEGADRGEREGVEEGSVGVEGGGRNASEIRLECVLLSKS